MRLKHIRQYYTLAAFVTMLVAPTLHLHAQNLSQLHAGVDVAGEIGTASGTFPVFAGSLLCGEFGNGSVRSISVGASILAPNFFAPEFGIRTRLSWVRADVTFTAVPIDAQPVFDSQSAQPIYLDRQYRFTAAHDLLCLDLITTFRPLSWLVVASGMSVSSTIASAFQQRDHVLGPGDMRFADGGTEHPLDGGMTFTSNPVSIGAITTVGYPISLVQHITLLPEVTARFDFTSPVNEATWHRLKWGIGVSMLYGNDEVDSNSQPPNVAPVTTLNASIDLYTIDALGDRRDSAVIGRQEILERRSEMLLPILFFDSNATVPSSRYIRPNREEATAFLLDSAMLSDPIAINHNILGIVARRMVAEPTATLTLVGCTSNDEPPTLAQKRVEAVRGYLRDTLGIDGRRLRIGTSRSPVTSEITEAGRAENRRVELLSNSPRLLEPVASEIVSRTFDAPTIGMTPRITADAGVRQWSITISQDNRDLARYSSDRTEGNTQSEIAWDVLARRMDTSVVTLVAELQAEDSVGHVVTARDEIPVTLLASPSAHGATANHAREVHRRTLCGFTYSSADISPAMRQAIAETVAEVRDSATVTILGRADRMGEIRFNADLSSVRATAVAAAVEQELRSRGIQGVTVRAVSENALNTNGDKLPEERMVMRGVVMIVEHIPQ